MARELGLAKLDTIGADVTKDQGQRQSPQSHDLRPDANCSAKAQSADSSLGADEIKKNETELDSPAEITRRQERLATIAAAKARMEERQDLSLLKYGAIQSRWRCT